MAKGAELAAASVQPIAEQIAQRLRPLTERLEIAGSLRRGRLWVHDIDLVAIRREVELFADDPFLAEVERTARGGSLGTAPKIWHWTVTVGGVVVPVDLYWATPETWTTLFFMRTGSAGHNVKVAMRARGLGMQWKADGTGFVLNGAPVPTDSEAAIFRTLGWPYLPPEARE